MIWSTDECLSILRYNSPIFIDCIFRSVSSFFVQCLIVMVSGVGTELYILCAYCLMRCKNEYLYCTSILGCQILLIGFRIKAYICNQARIS
ncbi:hypothetical protein HZS_5925 [Henneguya salminicola]|nr:hypothetical protein HZS_5925 [Henneguya salminicola]